MESSLALLLLVIGASAFLFMYFIEFRNTLDDVKEEVTELPSVEELNKMTKAKLVEFASESGIEINAKGKKADIVKEISSKA